MDHGDAADAWGAKARAAVMRQVGIAALEAKPRTIRPASDTRESRLPHEAAVALAQARGYCTPGATLTVAKRMPTAVWREAVAVSETAPAAVGMTPLQRQTAHTRGGTSGARND